MTNVGILFYMLAQNLTGGDAAGDVYTGFENVNGTNFNDSITSDEATSATSATATMCG